MTNSSNMPGGSMSGMASVFSVDTHVTLLFTDWTTDTAPAYAFTVLFLFTLGLFLRFLGALRSQFERRWDEQVTFAHVQRHRHNASDSRYKIDTQEEFQPLSPLPPTYTNTHSEKPLRNTRKFWVARGTWSAKHDIIRAIFEFLRAVIGYVLMLAVMTYNVGFFLAVTGSVLLGELLFGRYTHHGGQWQEGGCHE